MTNISAGTYIDVDKRVAETCPEAGSLPTNIVSALLIIVLPATFWLSMMELANYAFSWELSTSMRVFVSLALVGLLTFAWGFLLVVARQRQSLRLTAQLIEPDNTNQM